ncbi:glycosyl transferase family 2 [Raoultella planticola]|uniref:glycosyltransferase n=1 Tax=Raoultella ornithinolytica TaxID=54291 RepID=UPI0005E42B8D|nr:glycosyltransferase [Raoultella ornithinolytica]KJG61413.1 glycosyl transferase family 2 [Raoultella planticola]MCZ0881473.1 glycosyltransferase [Raoultella ornithinolytica]
MAQLNDESLKVSVYISTHNRLARLKRAMQSVLSQTYSNIEILVCDDASSDGTQEYMTTLCYKDKRVRYFRNETNQGACVTRNLGIFNATGYFITGLDDDDEFEPERVKICLDNWEDKYSFLSFNFYDCYNNDKRVLHYKKLKRTKYLGYKNILFDNLASNQVFTLTSRMREIGGFDVRAKRLQDWDTWLRLGYKFGTFKILPHTTYIMHHDHRQDEKRVSKAYPLSLALSDLKQRNADLYDRDESNFMDYLVSLENKKAKFQESITWAIKMKKPKYLLKYFGQYLSKNIYR